MILRSDWLLGQLQPVLVINEILRFCLKIKNTHPSHLLLRSHIVTEKKLPSGLAMVVCLLILLVRLLALKKLTKEDLVENEAATSLDA